METARKVAENEREELWQNGEDIYRVAHGAIMDTDGRPMGMRWECTIGAYRHYSAIIGGPFAGFKPVKSEVSRQTRNAQNRAKTAILRELCGVSARAAREDMGL